MKKSTTILAIAFVAFLSFGFIVMKPTKSAQPEVKFQKYEAKQSATELTAIDDENDEQW